jgi:pimeloyl-ACP methyl ester carboxylesterase
MLQYAESRTDPRRVPVAKLTQRFIRANGLQLHITEQGSGPLVLLCHGFPETSHAWRHQLPALAAAGYHAVAPDLRGYGASDCPDDVAAYGVLAIIGDLVALLDALGKQQAVIVGGDWGGTIAWQAARLRPDRFHAVVALGVPMMARAPAAPSRLLPKMDQAWFYTHYFSEPGLAEKQLEADIETALRKIYFAASGDAGRRNDPDTPNPFGMLPRHISLPDALPEPPGPLHWLPAADFAVFSEAFKKSGFHGGLNYYRNMDRNWADDAAFEGKRVEVAAMYLVGERDTGLAIPGMTDIIAAMPALVPNLRTSKVISNAGHWLQQEAADEVNAALIGFLHTL